jgi:hypothetical protein
MGCWRIRGWLLTGIEDEVIFAGTTINPGGAEELEGPLI